MFVSTPKKYQGNFQKQMNMEERSTSFRPYKSDMYNAWILIPVRLYYYYTVRFNLVYMFAPLRQTSINNISVTQFLFSSFVAFFAIPFRGSMPLLRHFMHHLVISDGFFCSPSLFRFRSLSLCVWMWRVLKNVWKL